LNTDFENKFLQNQAKQERTQRVTLLNTRFRRDGVIAEEKEAVLRVTEIHPFINLGKLLSAFLKENIALYTVEGIDKISFETSCIKIKTFF